MAASRLRVVWRSRTWGMFYKMSGSSVKRAAAMQGSAAFFAPLTRTVPSKGEPPRITSLSMGLGSIYSSGEFELGRVIERARPLGGVDCKKSQRQRARRPLHTGGAGSASGGRGPIVDG